MSHRKIGQLQVCFNKLLKPYKWFISRIFYLIFSVPGLPYVNLNLKKKEKIIRERRLCIWFLISLDSVKFMLALPLRLPFHPHGSQVLAMGFTLAPPKLPAPAVTRFSEEQVAAAACQQEWVIFSKATGNQGLPHLSFCSLCFYHAFQNLLITLTSHLP